MLRNIARKLIPAASAVVSTQFVQRHFGNFVPIFMLHRLDHPDYGIKGQNPAEIRSNLDYFRKHGYSAITLEELGRHIDQGTQPPYKSAVFTIDDGFIDHYDIAGPLFKEFDIPLTFFLVVDFIDGKLWPWDNHLSHLFTMAPSSRHEITVGSNVITVELNDKHSRSRALNLIREQFKSVDNTHMYNDIEKLYKTLNVDFSPTPPRHHTPMSWEQAAGLVRGGHCVAGHTCTHRILSRLQDDDAEIEITRSIRIVNDNVPGASSVFAYPTGRLSDFTYREVRILKKLEIQASVATIPAPFTYSPTLSDFEKHSLPRLPMPNSKIDFIQYLGWIEYLKHKIHGKRLES